MGMPSPEQFPQQQQMLPFKNNAISINAGDFGFNISTGNNIADVLVLIIIALAVFAFGKYVLVPGIKAWKRR